jgi:putative ABC transport system permease protein
MSWLDGLKHRIRVVFDSASYERELRDEMRLHEELDTVQQQDAYRARRRFGNRTYYQEETRRMTWLGSLDVLRQDLAYAWRSIRRTPGFAATVIITLALGIGLNATTFTLLDRIYLRPPAGVKDPETLRRIWTQQVRSGESRWSQSMSFPNYRALAQATSDSTSLASFKTIYDLHLGRGRKGPKLNVVYATANYFPVLGLRAALGRVYGADEDRFGAGAPVIVVSDHLWRTHLGGDSAALGKPIRLGANVYTMIGVLPRAFTGLEETAADAWIPLSSRPVESWEGSWWENEGMHVYRTIWRVPAGVDERTFAERATQVLRTGARERRFRVDTLTTVATGSIIEARGPGMPRQERIISSRLGGVAAIVLLIACANVANLLLARAMHRRREIAVRLALGISRWRLVRLLTSEMLLLAALAGAAAVLAAWWGGGILRSLLLPDVDWREPALHWRVVAFAVLVSILAGLVAGIIPALQSSNPQLTRALKEGSRDGWTHRSRLRGALVATQAALSVMLLVGAALFVRSLHNVRGVDTGYDVSTLVFGSAVFDDDLAPSDTVVAAEMIALAERLQSRPGVEAVARANHGPMLGWGVRLIWFGNESSASLRGNQPSHAIVSSEYFGAVGLKLLSGSIFDDRRGSPVQIVINETMARLLYPRENAVGQCIRLDKKDNPCYPIVGVVETGTRTALIEKEPVPQYYLPLGSMPGTAAEGTTVIVRASSMAMSAVRAELRSAIERAFPTGDAWVVAMSDRLADEYRPWQLGAKLFTGFGVLALLVAIVGIYSTMSYGVSQRTHEFGVRVALGARVGDVLRLVMGEGLRVVAVGVVLGIALALAAGRLISALLYGIEPSDPRVMLIVSTTLLVVAAIAALLPAWRAARVDPVTALRAD